MVKIKIKKIAFCAVTIALSFALSKIKIIPMPLGGSVTLFSMFVISIPGYFFGIEYGLISCIIFSLLKLMFGGYVYYPMQALLDYILSYSSFAVTGLFYKHNNKYIFICGYMLAVVLRFVFSSISGYVFFAEYTPEGFNPFLYAVGYNALYLFAEAFITVIVFLIPYINNNFFKFKNEMLK